MKYELQVKLREAGGIEEFISEEIKPNISDIVIVEMDRGYDYGEVVSDPIDIRDLEAEKKMRHIVRIATKEDLIQINRNKRRAKGAVRICERKISQYHLDMKLVDAEYSFDRTKIIFYFTSDERIDFRALVRDLAKVLKTRIELRQIGVRDEARILGGYGPCGRPLCCAAFLSDFNPVTVRLAKEQNLPLNPSKISGLCGRLMCCLSYERKFYEEMAKIMPKVGEFIEVEGEQAKVIDVNFIKKDFTIEFPDGRHKKLHRDDIAK
jgi:cell fate regulator YaaT (PSP1 superfamily)